MSDPSMTIGEVAARAGVAPSRIRFYERVGVLPAPAREGGRRRYDADVLRRLAVVDVAQRAGLTLEEIRDLTGAEARGPHAGERLRALADRKLPELDALVARAHAVRAWLELARRCDCETVDVCALFTDPALRPPPASPRFPGGVGPAAGAG